MKTLLDLINISHSSLSYDVVVSCETIEVRCREAVTPNELVDDGDGGVDCIGGDPFTCYTNEIVLHIDVTSSGNDDGRRFGYSLGCVDDLDDDAVARREKLEKKAEQLVIKADDLIHSKCFKLNNPDLWYELPTAYGSRAYQAFGGEQELIEFEQWIEEDEQMGIANIPSSCYYG